MSWIQHSMHSGRVICRGSLTWSRQLSLRRKWAGLQWLTQCRCLKSDPGHLPEYKTNKDHRNYGNPKHRTQSQAWSPRQHTDRKYNDRDRYDRKPKSSSPKQDGQKKTFIQSTLPGLDSKYKDEAATSDDWSDTFGTLSVDDDSKISTSFDFDEHRQDILDAEEEKTPHEHIPLGRFNRAHSPRWYAKKIEKLGKEGNVKRAIEVFDKWMIEQDRVRPERNNYFVLIRLLAQCGYVTKAFKLYNQMLRTGAGSPSPAMYTCLFNACANSPIPQIGLQKARQLQEFMLSKKQQPNYTTYQAMIKAFGICGDINMAFRLADQAAQIKVTGNLLSSLLGVCLHDKEAGFRHALLVWRKFQKIGVEPELRDYNLLLRAVNECGVGKQGITTELLQSVDSVALETNKKTRKYLSKSQRKRLEEFKQMDTAISKYETTEVLNGADVELLEENTEDSVGFSTETVSSALTTTGIDGLTVDLSDNKEWWELDIFTESSLPKSLVMAQPQLPNVLELDEDLSSVVSIEKMNKNEDRFALLGGLETFLQTLEKRSIKADIVTFTQLLKSVPRHEENAVIVAMKVAGVRADTDFYNHLIYRRSKFYKEAAFEAWGMMKEDGLTPNLRTFGCLALACDSREKGEQLLRDLDKVGLMPNSLIFNQLLVANGQNFWYQTELLRQMQEQGIKPTKHVVQTVEDNIALAKEKLAPRNKEALKPGHHKDKELIKLEKDLYYFLMFYDQWARHNKMEKPEHPWAAFQDPK